MTAQPSAATAPNKYSKFIGERIIYDVKFGNITLGQAELRYLSEGVIEGRHVNILTFTTRLLLFSDTEKIYSDTDKFLPLRVEREVYLGPGKEKIIEEYDQKNFTLTIKKIKDRKEESTLIKRDSEINNAILLPYCVRNIPDLRLGWSLTADLVVDKFKIELVSIEDINTPAGVFKAYRFESTPKSFSIWVTADERRIPVKIEGAGALSYTLVMKEYNL